MKLARTTFLAGAISACCGALMILEWIVPPLSQLLLGHPSPLFAPVIATAFLLIGSVLMAAPRRIAWIQTATRVVAVLLGAVACARIAMEFVAWPWMRNLVPVDPNSATATSEGYFSALTASQLLLASAGLAMLSCRGRFRAAEGFAASLGIAIGLVALGYIIRFLLGGQGEGSPFFEAVIRSGLFSVIAVGLFCAAADEGGGPLAPAAARGLREEIKLSIAFGTTLGIGVLGGLLCLGLLVRFAEDDRHHLQVTRLAGSLNRIQYSAQTAALAASSYADTGRASDLVPYNRALAELEEELASVTVQPVTREQQALVDAIAASLRVQIASLQTAIDRRQGISAGDAAPIPSATERAALFDQVSAQIARAERELQHDLDRRAVLRASSRTRTQVFFLCGVFGVGAILFGAHVLFERDLIARRRADAALSRHNETLKSFAHTVAHDLRAPLRGIAGYARELEQRSTGLDDRSRFCVAQIGTAAQNLERLIEDTLDYARLDAEPLQFADIDLPMLVTSLIRERAPQIGEYHAEIATQFGVTNIVSWERGLAQILGNLLDNALKYSRNSRPPRIRIESTETPLAWRLAVRDNGVGFDMKYHDRIFGLFQRLVTRNQFEGTGAGLAIVRKITDRLGGTVQGESAPGDGATFVVELPKSAAAQAATRIA